VTLQLLFSLQVALLALAVLAVPLAASRRGPTVVYAGVLLLSAAALSLAGAHLLAPDAEVQRATLQLGIPWMGAHFRLDGLSAFFVAIINLGTAASSLYAIGYGRHESQPGRVLPFYCAFPAGMNLVLLADDAFAFLLAWEFMSLASWALVLSHHKDAENARAGFIYLVMASFGTLALLLAFGLLAGPEGGYVFDQMRASRPEATIAGLALVLTLIGAGSKAGVVPLHVWLPLAHPAAPSHVSALMSGVMTKVALYAIVRIVFDLAHAATGWGSVTVLIVGGLTAALGVLYALMEHDLKRLLAYSTVENVGVIVIGIGLAMAFQADGAQTAAALALTAALLHALNHSLFKSLLFFGAGAVLNATGERDMERLGGLVHRMPRTAFAFLVGAAAISALPPLNGFVSEWLTFQGILLSPQLDSWILRFLVPAIGALLALAAALAAACFVKAFGITFLGRPRSEAARDAREVDGFSVAAMGLVAIACFVVGLFPGIVMDALAPATQATLGARVAPQASLPWLSVVPIDESRSSYDALLLFVFIVVSMLITTFAIHRLASRALRRAPAWDCGTPDPSPITQYTADSVAQPIRRVFGTIPFGAEEVIDMPPPGDARPAGLRVHMRDRIWDAFYAPVGGSITYVAHQWNRFQFLTIRKYLTLVFTLLVFLLLVVVVRQ
jgi:formate hydrogenlyase subunit 3/multisubunit Na+/H+ antiporter MnhD subunit